MPENGGVDRSFITPHLPDKELLRPGLIGFGFGVDPLQAKVTLLESRLDEIMEYLRQEQQALARGFDLLGQVVNEHPEMINLAFFQDNVSASQSSVALSDGRSTRGYCMPEDGSVVAIAVRTNDDRTADTLTVEAAINGSVTGLTAVLNATDTTSAVTLQDQGLDTFAAGAAITCEITTGGSWAPTTADIIVTVAVVLAKGVR